MKERKGVGNERDRRNVEGEDEGEKEGCGMNCNGKRLKGGERG